MIKGRKDLAILYSKKKMVFISDLKYLRCKEFETTDIAGLNAELKKYRFSINTHQYRRKSSEYASQFTPVSW